MFGRFEFAQPAGTLSRRRFLQVSALAGGGFLIGFRLPAAAAQEQAAETPAALNPFIRIASDNTVTVVVKHLDKGQGVTTGLPTIVAEELDADWSQMRAEFAPADAETYKNLFFGVQGTGGSTSIANSWTQLRTAAASARQMLLQAAAERWEVAPEALKVEQGLVRELDGSRQASFGDLAAEAANIPPPAEPALKQPSQFRLIGTRVPRLDSPAKTNGSATFTIDVTRPDMLAAVVAHPPRFGAIVKDFDATKAAAMDGVRHVVRIPRGIAVLADSYHTASKARAALDIEWDESAAETRGSKELLDLYRGKLDEPGLKARREGDVTRAMDQAHRTVEADFELPYLAHATMEPMDCVVELHPDRCEIWTGSQLQTVDQNVVAQITGLPPRQVFIHTHFAGGSFGRRAVPDSDYVAEAAMIAKAIDGAAPVKLHWSREDDMRGGRYRPMSVHRLKAGLDASGKLTAWHHRIAVQSILAGTPFESMVRDGIDNSSVEGAANLPYAVPNLQVELHSMEVGVPVLWWRSVGHTQNAFVTEVLLDRVADAAGRDPVELRRELLSEHPRHLGVLELAAEKSGWGEPMTGRRGRGIAVHESFNSFVAEVVDLSVDTDGVLTVDRVVCVVDCGIAVNPDVIRAQMEGGIAFGLSAALREAVTLVDGVVQQSNFDSYRPLRINEMPDIQVHIVASSEAPTGVGEPGVPPLAPALANAIFQATGRQINRLPLGNQLKSG